MAEMRRMMSQGFIGLAVGMASGFVALATLVVVASL
jgi:tetrahydromethanopterin S-methyltransferase subunit F